LTGCSSCYQLRGSGRKQLETLFSQKNSGLDHDSGNYDNANEKQHRPRFSSQTIGQVKQMLKRLAIFACLIPALAAAAQTVQPILLPHATYVDAAGDPCVGCFLYSYAAGTTTPLNTYTDSTGGTPNTNPIVLGTDGGAAIWLSSSSYKFILKDAGGTPIWTVDNVSGLAGFCLKTGCTMTGALVAPTINNVQYPTTFATLQTAVTACSGNPCTIAINTTIAVPSSYAIPSYVTVQFNNGAQLQPANGQVLTISGPIQAPPVRIFGGAGTEALSALVPRAFAQWWGAVADSNATGSTGTDNTATLQAGLNAIGQGSELFLPAGDYKITSALLINRSQVSLRGAGAPATYTPGWPTPHPSRIVTTSTTADIIDLWGSSTSVNVADNAIEDLTLSRGAIPSAAGSECSVTGAGVSMKFSYAAIVQNLTIEDSATGMYFHGVGASARGHIENIDAIWGSNGVTETTGLLCGFYEDSKDGTASPSLRIRNYDAQAPQIPFSHPTLTIYGFAAKGKQMSDIHSYHFEAYAIDIGISLIGAGMNGFAQGTDCFFENSILDNVLQVGIEVKDTLGYGTFNFSDSWLYINGASSSPAVNISASANVHLNGVVIFAPTITAPVISAVNGGSEQFVNNEIIGGTAGAITLDGTVASVISNNIVQPVAPGNWGTNIISLVNASSYSTVSNNSLNGTATNGIYADVTTVGTGGLETNSIGDPALGTVTNILNVSANNFTPIYNGIRVGVGTVTMTGSQGNGALVQHSTGAPTSGNLTKFDANNNTVDAGVAAAYIPQNVFTCGSSTTCSNTPQPLPRIVLGTVTLSSGSPSTAVVTGMTAWTATSSYVCTVSNMTTQADPVKVSNTSTTSITISGPNTVTDTVSYICVGN
jgi:hypothetical protein